MHTILERKIKFFKDSQIIEPIMISSATDAYQYAELKFGITRKCIELLTRHKIPFYIFTKSIIILRDIDLFQRNKELCFIVWSITTPKKEVKRKIEPGTPNFELVFTTMKKFIESDIRCVVNINPIIPLLNDSITDLRTILDRCIEEGVKYITFDVLRLRHDIWKRLKIIFKNLDIWSFEKYYKKIYEFSGEMKENVNYRTNFEYRHKINSYFKEECKKRNLILGFPKLESKRFQKNNQTSILNYI